MTECGFTLAGACLTACASGALWWPSERLLCVADLHLGKSERMAQRGGALLPPYETAETLERLDAEITRRDPACVVCLGDSFDDDDCAGAIPEAGALRLRALMAPRDWVWIAGNHDPAPMVLGGRHAVELAHGPLTFRHIAIRKARAGEISGHYHPKTRVPLRGRDLARPCFLRDAVRVILPAFGAYTGGLWTDHPALKALIPGPACAILTGDPCVTVPIAAASKSSRSAASLG